jgi:pyruvate ferredoxin oxidoreductase alpha subunit
MTRSYISGCKAAAEGAKLAGVEVVAAYPITPQTSIVEELASSIANGQMRAEMIHVEGEHSAMTACIGASAVGARAFTATSAQGLAMMNEPLFMAAGMRFPIVMVVVNRSLVAPNTIFCDHQDSLSTRDTGWLQFYVESCQEALDTVLVAYKVAEDPRVLLPAMVCLDGFFLSHLYEPVEVPSTEQAAAFLPPLQPAYPLLDPAQPRLLNVLVPPEYYTEFEYDKHQSSMQALAVMAEAFDAFETQFGRRYGAVEAYQTEDADMIIVAMGSMVGTAREAVDRARAAGKKIGLLKIKAFRPFPSEEVRMHLCRARAVGTVDRNVSYGSTGALYQEVARCLYGSGAARPDLTDFVVGLGGRDVSLGTYAVIFEQLEAHCASDRTHLAVIWADANRDLLESWGIG